MKEKKKSFKCRNCGERIFSRIKPSKCGCCGDNICSKCKIQDLCMDCFVSKKPDKLINIYELAEYGIKKVSKKCENKKY